MACGLLLHTSTTVTATKGWGEDGQQRKGNFMKLQNILKTTFITTSCLLQLIACGSAGTDTADSASTGTTGTTDGSGSEETSQAETAEVMSVTSSAIIASFAASSDTANLKSSNGLLAIITDKLVGSANADANDTCTSETPEGINYDIDGISGTYGSDADPITVEQDDFCFNLDTNQNSTGLGPDGDGLFASFQFRPETVALATCTNANGTSTVELSGEGIYRNTLTFTEIYGTFTVVDPDGVEHGANCTIILNTDSTVFDASCTDVDSGDDITLDEDTECEIEVETTA